MMIKLLDRLEIKFIENVPILKLLPEFYLNSVFQVSFTCTKIYYSEFNLCKK